MAQTLKFRSSMEICEDIAAVLEKADPLYYWPEEHDKNVQEANAFLCGRRMVSPRSYLSSIRRTAAEGGYAAEMQPLITEARRFLTLREPPKEKEPSRSGPGR